jgi:hypothetical protein
MSDKPEKPASKPIRHGSSSGLRKPLLTPEEQRRRGIPAGDELIITPAPKIEEKEE